MKYFYAILLFLLALIFGDVFYVMATIPGVEGPAQICSAVAGSIAVGMLLMMAYSTVRHGK